MTLTNWDIVQLARHSDAIQHLLENPLKIRITCRHGTHLNDDCDSCEQDVKDLIKRLSNEEE